MVGAREFEPPASWSGMINHRIISNLARHNGYSRLRFVASYQHFAREPARALATARNASMKRVGTKSASSLAKSIDCNGRLGFWDVPDSIARLISRQLK